MRRSHSHASFVPSFQGSIPDQRTRSAVSLVIASADNGLTTRALIARAAALIRLTLSNG